MSPLGCSPCRKRGVPCDRARPTCLNCLKGRTACDVKGPIIVRRSLRSNHLVPLRRALLPQQPYHNAREGRAFHYIAIDLAPLLGKLIDDVFWIENVLPTAYQDQRLFYAILAFSAPFHNDTWKRESGHDQQAMQWYSKSIDHSISKLQDSLSIASNIKMCVFYSLLENTHGHKESASKLLGSAFAMVCSSKNKLTYSEDTISTLCWLADTNITSSIGLIRVPNGNFETVCRIGLDMSRVSRHQARYSLGFKLWQISYDVDNLLIHQDHPQDLQQRIDLYETQLERFRVTQGNKMVFLRLKFLYVMARLQHDLYQGHPERTIQLLIKNLQLASGIQECRPLILNSYIGPGLGFLLWHYRNDKLKQDIADILRTFNQPECQASLDYWFLLYHLIMSGRRAAIAEELWGEYPRIVILRKWLRLVHLGGGVKNLYSVSSFLEYSPAPPSLSKEDFDTCFDRLGTSSNSGDQTSNAGSG